MHLSGDRELTVDVSFAGAWPSITLLYTGVAPDEAAEVVQACVAEHTSQPVLVWARLRAWLQMRPRPMPRRVLIVFAALALMIALAGPRQAWSAAMQAGQSIVHWISEIASRPSPSRPRLGDEDGRRAPRRDIERHAPVTVSVPVSTPTPAPPPAALSEAALLGLEVEILERLDRAECQARRRMRKIASGLAIALAMASCGGPAKETQGRPPRRDPAAGPPAITVDTGGTVRLPEFDVPYSDLASEGARRNFIDVTTPGVRNPVPPGVTGIDGVRTALDDLRMRPVVERLRAIFPVTITPQAIAGIQTDIVEPANGVSQRNRTRVLINLHGGGFSVGARYGGQQESIPIASIGAIKVITVDYRMAPEHHFPAASEDVAAVYKALLTQHRPEEIGI